MRELYGINGLKYVTGLVFVQLLSFLSLLAVCVLFWLKVNHSLSSEWWIVSLPLFVFYPAAAALVGLLWEGLSGSLFRLDLVSIPARHRRLFVPLLGLCVIAAVQLHLLLILGSGNNPDYFSTLMMALPVFVLGAGTIFSFWILRLVLHDAIRKNRRVKELRSLLKDFEERFDAQCLPRIKEFVSLESGQSRSNPPRLIRGAVFPGLSSKVWYEVADFKWAQDLEAGHKTIAAEILAVNQTRAGFERYSYPGLGKINWQSFVLFKGGKKVVENCARCPETTRLLETVPGCQRREAMFSVLEPGVRIPPHRDSGNQLLTCHLGLVIPPHCGLRVGGETRLWAEGKCLIFDTSYEHEAWNSSGETRIVLLTDFWHPELSEVERQFLDQVEGLGYW